MSTISAGTTVPTGITLTADTTGALTFQVSGTVTAATINTSGNLGVGIASPLQRFNAVNTSITGGAPATSGSAADPNAVARFQAGSVAFDIGVYTAGQMWLQPRSFTNYAINYDLVLQPNGGNVGIGTASPGTKLDVYSSSTTSTLIRTRNDTTSVYLDANNGYSYLNTFTNHPMLFGTNNAERMRIDASGNIGIGTTNPAGYKLRIAGTSGAAQFRAGTDANGYFEVNAFDSSPVYCVVAGANATAGVFGTQSNIPTIFFSNNTERMRIDSSGNVGINVVPASGAVKLQVKTGTDQQLWVRPGTDLGGANGIAIQSSNDAGSGSKDLTLYGTAISLLGGEVFVNSTTDNGAYNLQCNGTGVWGAGAYVNGSDARLKDNIQSLDAGLDVVKAMRPVTFQYKPEYSKDQSVQPGFIAQELQTAMAGKPYLEGVVQEGPNHLNVAYQNIIPILVKAIQELEAKVAALEAK